MLSEKKYICTNEAFMTKRLHNAVMKKLRLKNKCLRNRSQKNEENYKNHWKNHKIIEYFIRSLDINKITNNRTFRTIFSQKRRQKVENCYNWMRKNISDEKKLCQTFSNFFQMLFPVWKCLTFEITF